MSDHLPECQPDEPYPCVCDDCCICDRLRACEQRSYALGIEVGKHDGWLAGRAAGVVAARDAVAGLPKMNLSAGAIAAEALNPLYVVNRDQALAAIDALTPDPHRAHREDGVQWCEDCTDDTDDRPTPCELHRARGQRWCADCYEDAEAENRHDREKEAGR